MVTPSVLRNEVSLYVLPWKDDQDMLVLDARIYVSHITFGTGHLSDPHLLALPQCMVLQSVPKLSLGLEQQDCHLLLPLDSQASHIPRVSTSSCYYWNWMEHTAGIDFDITNGHLRGYVMQLGSVGG